MWLPAELSVRGKGHVVTGKPCQDASRSATCLDGKWLVGAVADGGGSLAYSDIGSLIASDYVVALTQEFIEKTNIDEMPTDELREVAQQHWLQTAVQIRELLKHEAAIEGNDVGQYGTTLIAFAISKNRLIAFQLGDGFLVVDSSGNEDCPYQLIFEAQQTEHVGEVTWITSSAWQRESRSSVQEGDFNFVCASTDGLEKVAIVQSSQQPFSSFFGPLRKKASDVADAKGLRDVLASILNMPSLDLKTDDDKTLLLGLRRS